MNIVIDFETRSEIDLKKQGLDNYSKHESTEVICVAYKIKSHHTKIWWPLLNEPVPLDLAKALHDPKSRIVAHNVGFEWSIYHNVILKRYDPNNILPKKIPIKKWRCTAAKAASHGLPRSLGDACDVLGLAVQKDMRGHKIMLKLSKPRPTWVKKGTGDKYFFGEEDVKTLGEYCIKDTEAEYYLDKAIPNLIYEEKLTFRLDHEMNQRGVTIDLKLVRTVIKLLKQISFELHDEFSRLAFGKVQSPSQVKELLTVLKDDLDSPMSDLKAETVRLTLLEENLDPTVRRLLELRQLLSKTSTAKFKAFLAMTNASDKKLRNTLLYWGAHTGRWSGKGVQLQNLPSKTSINDLDTAAEIVLTNDLDFIKAMYKDPMAVLSAITRSVITASPGCELFVGDFAAIEARVLFWFAQYRKGLKMFQDGIDLYVEEASSIYGISASNVNKNQRGLGKVAILGLGYGMGEDRFYETAISWGVKEVSVDLASKAVKSYRKRHSIIPKLWASVEKAAIAAVLNPGQEFPVNYCKFFYNEDSKFLYCILPSGRSIAYYGPKISKGKTPWGEVRPVLQHWGVDSITKAWVFRKTYGGKLVENICQAIARDLMVHSMFSIKEKGFDPLLSVHDELIAEAIKAQFNVKDFEEAMKSLPKWAVGFPTAVEVWKGKRYKK